MNWRFSCETHSSIPLPPKYAFPRAFNYLNSERNSFYILENDNGYIQCGGGRDLCTIEFRIYADGEQFKHFVFYNPSGTCQDVHIKMSDGGVYRKQKHCFDFLDAARLFKCFYEDLPWPDYVAIEEITSDFI